MVHILKAHSLTVKQSGKGDSSKPMATITREISTAMKPKAKGCLATHEGHTAANSKAEKSMATESTKAKTVYFSKVDLKTANNLKENSSGVPPTNTPTKVPLSLTNSMAQGS